jgi:hypothetical protein
MTQDSKTAFATLNPATRQAVAEACGVPKADTVQAQKAFAAYGSGMGALSALQSGYGVTRPQVLGAWSALSSGDRAALVGIAQNMHNEPQKIAILDRVASQMAQRLNLGAAATPQLRRVAHSLALLQSIGRGGIGG